MKICSGIQHAIDEYEMLWRHMINRKFEFAVNL